MNTYLLENDRGIDDVGLYEFNSSIYFIRYKSEFIEMNDYLAGKTRKNFIMVEMFSKNLESHQQKILTLESNKRLSSFTTDCYVLNNRFYINTKKYCSRTPIESELGKLIEIENDELKVIGDSPEPVNEVSFDNKEYIFGKYVLRMSTSYTLECRNKELNQIIWKINLRSYLYTDIELKADYIFLGTAGNGGNLFCIELSTGRLIYKFNSGGTTKIVLYKSNIIVLDRKGKPTLIDYKTGKEIKKVDIQKFYIRDCKTMVVQDDILYSIGILKDKEHVITAELS